MMTKKLKFDVGSFVAFNMLKDATWFEVVKINGFHMEVREEGLVDGKHFAAQYADTSMVKQVRKV
jgi:hypothetical protein